MLLIESYGMQQNAEGGTPSIGPMVIAANGPGVLFEILRSDVGLAVWSRALMPTLLAEFASLPAMPAFEAVAEKQFDRVAASLLDGVPCTLPSLMHTDIDSLAAMFAVVAMTSTVRCRLRSLAGCDAPFLAESARLRLLCAYQGLGIDWLLSPDGTPGRLDPFSAMIVKGSTFPGTVGQGSRHRPAIEPGRAGNCLLLDIEAV